MNRPVAVLLARGVFLGAVAVNALVLPVAAAQNAPPLSASDPAAGSRDIPAAAAPAGPQAAPAQPVRLANFGLEVPSPESRKLADWIVDSANNGNLPFMIIDKVQARVFMFDAQGQLRGADAALLGLAIGDHSVPGIGERKLSSILPAERTTPAGRFVASLDRDIHGHEVLWVDYDTALSLHRVVKGQPKERRAERLASSSPLDNRISFGCINVPVKFYETVVSPSFTGTNGIVYILPETRSAREVFGSYDVQDASRNQASAGVAPVAGSSVR
ncbi:hypothetical protein [Polaromonas eurypsychrophila]|uniref:hypothetical protein n=1 Tax=Polaromonas eurypsychrophila TaxID=1614635 RepID=UPI00166679AC|nr:hypothetical protein [Polaromonas eurypsychrophila]